jgi:hypothetical protein
MAKLRLQATALSPTIISGPVFHDVVKSAFIRIHLINGQTALKTEPFLWLTLLFALIVMTSLNLACERATTLKFEGGNPPRFVMTGSGSLGLLRVRGPEKQRDAPGENTYLYWVIKPLNSDSDRSVERMGLSFMAKCQLDINRYIQRKEERLHWLKAKNIMSILRLLTRQGLSNVFLSLMVRLLRCHDCFPY